MRILAPAAALAIVTTLLLGGCVPTEPSASPTPEPSSTTVFASEEEALAAAEEAYAAYQAGVDHALSTYETTGLNAVAAEGALDAAISSVEAFRAEGKHLVGVSTTRVVELVQGGSGLGFEDPAQVYACLDISGTDVVNANNESTLSADRVTLVPTLVSLDLDADRLVVSQVEVWDGDNFCP